MTEIRVVSWRRHVNLQILKHKRGSSTLPSIVGREYKYYNILWILFWVILRYKSRTVKGEGTTRPIASDREIGSHSYSFVRLHGKRGGEAAWLCPAPGRSDTVIGRKVNAPFRLRNRAREDTVLYSKQGDTGCYVICSHRGVLVGRFRIRTFGVVGNLTLSSGESSKDFSV